MVLKLNKNRAKVILVFLIFMFFSILIFSLIQIQKYNKIAEDNAFKVGNAYIDFDIHNIVDKFTKYRSEEFINNKDYSKEVSLRKENDRLSSEEQIKWIKEDIRTRKGDLTNNNNISKEERAEEMKKLDEEEKEKIEEITSIPKKTDEVYKNELIQMELANKLSVDERVNAIGNFKYFIVENKSGDFETNSSYDKSEIDEKFYTNSKYSVKLLSDNKTSVASKEYIDGKSVNSTDNKLENSKSWIKGRDVTLYIWVPNELWENKALNKTINDYLIAAVVSATLILITIILLWITRKKVQLNYSIYKKVPFDIFLIVFLPICFLYVYKSGLFYIWGMFKGYNIKYLNPYILIGGAGVVGTILVTYIEFIRKQSFKKVYENGIFPKVINDIKASIEVRNIIFKLSLVFLLLILEVIFVGNSYFIFRNMWPIVPVVLIIIDVMIFLKLVNKLVYFNKIIEETEKISSGNLTLVLEEKGKGSLCKLAHNINSMKIGLKNSLENEMRSERMKSELITNVSHDLKTPLTSIINYIDLLKKETLTPDKANDYVKILDRKSKRLKSLIEDLFEASKAASGAMELNIEKIEITELIKQTLAEFEDKILSSTLDFKVNLGNEKVYAMGDGKRTYRVFENLVQNALKYSMKHSRVYVDLIKDEKTTQLIIKNMASYEMNFNADEIAERFKRGDEARTTEGSGLGLAIAKSIMELQKGELKIEIDGDLFKAIVIFKE